MRPGLLLVLAALVISLVILAWPQPADAPVGTHHVLVQGPQDPLFAGNVTATSTPLALLLGTGLVVEVTDSGAFGACSYYVESIAGHRAHGAAGWTFQVREPAQEWRHPLKSADCVKMAADEELRWRWTEDGVS